MKAYLKKFFISKFFINPPAPSNKKGKATAQKEAKKDNATALKFLMDGLQKIEIGVLLRCLKIF